MEDLVVHNEVAPSLEAFAIALDALKTSIGAPTAFAAAGLEPEAVKLHLRPHPLFDRIRSAIGGL